MIYTIEGYDYSAIDERALTHDGCIVDAGCFYWDWSAFFIGKKRVIGIDPLELIEKAELYRGILGPCDGNAFIGNNKGSSSMFGGKNRLLVSMISWKSFCRQYHINKVSVLKLNVEGAEYSILHSLDLQDYAKIDQIAVSFHDFLNDDWVALTRASLHLLEDVGYNLTPINKQYNWWLAKK
jgi:hypothetical protein